MKYKGDDARSRANLALALARNWRAKDAVPHAEQAVKLSKGQDPDMLDLLGSLYAETSRFPDAAATERKLLALVEKKGDPRMIAAVRAKIALYEAGRVE